MAVEYGSLPFAEAIRYLLDKTDIPTARWDDISGQAHDRYFMVAGAAKADLLADLHGAVGKAIEQGTTIETFRKDFAQIVAARGWHGWTGEGTKAGEAWRTRVIYATNLRTSYAAGRYSQMKALADRRPYWRYKHNDTVVHPRPHHLAWDGTVLRHDDPWWDTHYTPNGWGCRCYVETLAPRDLEREGITPGPAPESPIDPKTGAPVGIDKGWDHAPGANTATPLRDLLGNTLARVPAPIGAAMARALEGALSMELDLAWKDTLDRWLADPVPRGRTALVGALKAPTLEWLRSHGHPVPPTAEVAVRDSLPLGPKQERHMEAQDGLLQMEWRGLPAVLRDGAVYYQDAGGHLVFVANGIGPAKLAVVFDPRKLKRGDYNLLVSAYRTSAEAVAGMVKGGQWRVAR